MSLWYFLIKCIKEGKPVVWVSWNYDVAYLFNRRGVLAIPHPLKGDRNLQSEALFQSDKDKDLQNTVCLVNSGRNDANYPSKFDALGCYRVIASSPNGALIGHWYKHKWVVRHVMAPPSIEEVIALVYVTLF
jgi:hypothetical protein